MIAQTTPFVQETGEIWQNAAGERIAHIEHDNGTWTAVDCRGKGSVIGASNWTENVTLFRSMGYEHVGFLSAEEPSAPKPTTTPDTDQEPEPYEPGVFGGAHPGDDEDTEDAPAFVPAPSPMLAKAIAENRKRQAAKKQRNSPTAAIARAEAAWDAEDAETEAERRIAEMAANVTLTDLRNLHAIHPDHARDHARHIIDTTDVSAPMTPETRPALIARHAQIETARAWLDASPAPEPPAPTPDYATIPAIGGGSHEADTTTKQRAATTSQKRDNQRAERAALNEAYHANAETHAPDIAAILTDLGFTVTEQRESGGTPVTIWQSEHATIKQTPYTIRVYNGQPKRLPRHGDAELINSVEAGWIMRTQPTGYAAGVVAAILPLIETPDPYMQALDAMEAREAEQSAPTPAECRRCMKRATCDDMGYCATCAAEFDSYGPARFAEAMTSYALDDDDTLPELVLHGGQPSMSGPWQAPAISGGSQDAETCAECGNALRPYEQGAGHGTCFACQSARAHALDCQHDADEPPARFCSQCGHDASPAAPQPTDTGSSHDVTMPTDPEPVVYEIEITTQDLNDAPYYSKTATYHCRSQRGIEAQRRAVIKRANRAADALNVPDDSVIAIHCDDADSDVRYHNWYTRKEHRLFLAMQAGDARAADDYEAEMFKRITD